jgi:hypothetical protein
MNAETSRTKSSSNERVVVVVAATSVDSRFQARLNSFDEEVRGKGRVVLVDGTPQGITRTGPAIERIRSQPGSLVPELWRDGWRGTSEPMVALTTIWMFPCEGWLDALIDHLERTKAAAVAGAIEPSGSLSPLDRALYLLRYVDYHRPLAPPKSWRIPGENTLYRREAVEGIEPDLDTGFWESEVNRLLVDRGHSLVTAESAVLSYEGGASARETLRSRFLHARRFGVMSASRMGLPERIARTMATPLVPPLMLGRILRNTWLKGISSWRWLEACPWLPLLLGLWSMGEATGRWSGPLQRPILGIESPAASIDSIHSLVRGTR